MLKRSMITTNPSIWPGNPLRVPDWRWHLAAAITKGECKSSAADSLGAGLSDDVAALLGLDQASDFDLDEHANAILSARQIWSDEAWDRVLLESRLLAGANVAGIAGQLHIDRQVVAAYHNCFFDIVSRLRHTSYINRVAIRAPAHYDEPADLPTAFRAFAYFGGEHVLDAVVAAHTDVIEECSLSDRAMTMSLDPALKKSVQTAVRTFLTPITAENAATWLELYVDQYAAEILGGRRRTQRSIDAALRRCSRPCRSGDEPTAQMDHTDGAAVEQKEATDRCDLITVPPTTVAPVNCAMSVFGTMFNGIAATPRCPTMIG